MVRFAIKTLLGDRGKMLTAVIGVVFSLVLVNVQGGLYWGLIRKASLLVDNCEADIWIGHVGLENVDFAEDIPETWINRIRGLPEVERAEPYILGKGVMTLPDGGYEDIWVMGADADSMLGGAWSFAEGSEADLRKPNAVTVENVERWKLANPEIGNVVEISGYRARVVAFTDHIVPFLTLPYCFTTVENARRFCRKREGFCSYFLVKAVPGTNIKRLQARLRRLIEDTEVFTKAELSHKSIVYWTDRTGIGISFGMATWLGVVVGLVMVAQSLYALVIDHLIDYATLKAMGATNRVVYNVIFVQALTIATLGILLGLGVIQLVQVFYQDAYAPIVIRPDIRLRGIALVILICLLACVLPFRRIRNVDPATVLQG